MRLAPLGPRSLEARTKLSRERTSNRVTSAPARVVTRAGGALFSFQPWRPSAGPGEGSRDESGALFFTGISRDQKLADLNWKRLPPGMRAEAFSARPGMPKNGNSAVDFRMQLVSMVA
jgi:hypothetical protein